MPEWENLLIYWSLIKNGTTPPIFSLRNAAPCCAVMGMYQKWCTDSQKINHCLAMCHPQLSDRGGKQKVLHVVHSYCMTTVWQITSRYNSAVQDYVSHHTVHHSLLCVSLCSRWSGNCTQLLLTNETKNIEFGQWMFGGKSPGLINQDSLYIKSTAKQLKWNYQQRLYGTWILRWLDILLWAMFCWDT